MFAFRESFRSCCEKMKGRFQRKFGVIKLQVPETWNRSRIVRLLVAGAEHLRLHTRFPSVKAHAVRVSSLFLRFSSTALVDRRASLTMSVLMTLSSVRLCMMPTRPIVGAASGTTVGGRSILAQEFINDFNFQTQWPEKKPRRCHARFQRLAPDPIFGSERRQSA